MDPCELESINRKKKTQELMQLTIVLIMKLIVIVTTMIHEQVHQIKEVPMQARDKLRHRLANVSRLIRESDMICRNELRVNRHTFGVLCEMVSSIGELRSTKNMEIDEMVAMFLFTLAHHKKNRSIANYFVRSGESVSRQFNLCLRAVLKLHDHLLKKPTPIPEDCEDSRWKYFKSCLGALDGTFISVHVANNDRSRYRTRKGALAMNVLGVCTPNMEFIYVLPGWEGSAHDGHVLRDAISRPNGFKVPKGCYYLVDAGYTNCEEYFNMKHAKARNVIERCFGLLKGRWAILRSPSFFPIRTQGRIVSACALLHNLIRKYMPTDVVDLEVEEDENEYEEDDENEEDEGGDDESFEYITQVSTSDAWDDFRNSIAQTSYDNWMLSSS